MREREHDVHAGAAYASAAASVDDGLVHVGLGCSHVVVVALVTCAYHHYPSPVAARRPALKANDDEASVSGVLGLCEVVTDGGGSSPLKSRMHWSQSWNLNPNQSLNQSRCQSPKSPKMTIQLRA